jgi:hypothetical protein
MEDWEILNDLLKFRRGYERGQIGVGVILQQHYETSSLRNCVVCECKPGVAMRGSAAPPVVNEPPERGDPKNGMRPPLLGRAPNRGQRAGISATVPRARASVKEKNCPNGASRCLSCRASVLL